MLVNGFLVIPAASARLICQYFVPFLATAAGIGATSGVIGMVISGAIDLPSGSSIVLVQLLGFLLVALCRRGLKFFNFFSAAFQAEVVAKAINDCNDSIFPCSFV